MSGFTGDYYDCLDCGHIYDFDDICPNCGSGNVVEILPVDIVNKGMKFNIQEQKRLNYMLDMHDDMTIKIVES